MLRREKPVSGFRANSAPASAWAGYFETNDPRFYPSRHDHTFRCVGRFGRQNIPSIGRKTLSRRIALLSQANPPRNATGAAPSLNSGQLRYSQKARSERLDRTAQQKPAGQIWQRANRATFHTDLQ